MKIPEIKLIPQAESEEARDVLGFEWAGEGVGSRHKLGGEPDWLQKEEVPVCPSCGEPMTFYGQLDSIGDQIMIGDCGIVYVFVCLECIETQAVLQFS